MDVQSMGFRTEIPLLEMSGSLVEDHDTHLVVRTPGNPHYYWGNFLLLPEAPGTVEEVGHWLAEHRRAFPEAKHRTLGIDRVDGADLSPLSDAGMTVEVPVAMTATSVHPPPRPDTTAEIRRLDGDDEWEQVIDLTLAGEEDDAHLTRDFIARKTAANRSLVAGGHGHWWGAFSDGRLVASMGIVRAGVGLARFQSVKTHPDHRGRGLAGTLVHRASTDAFATLDAQTLVMVADPDYLAIRVYRSVGFVDGGSHGEATLLP
ncbi:MAG: GNAT family N-acetyltransferase [Nocardioides sp.]